MLSSAFEKIKWKKSLTFKRRIQEKVEEEK